MCATLVNVNLTEGARPATPADFMHQRSAPPKRQTPEQQLAVIKAMHRAFGGDMRDFDKGKK